MKLTYKESAIKRTLTFSKEIEKSINQLGKPAFREILNNYFGLTTEGTIRFIRLIENMKYFEPGYDTIPEDWFFEEVGPVYKRGEDGKKTISETVGHLSSKIFEEREKIRQTIIQFRKLPERLKEIAEKSWPESYRPYPKKGQRGQFGPTAIAYQILSNRWGIGEDALKKNVSNVTKRKRANKSE